MASFAHQGVSREHPLLSATLPDGSRIQVVAPPATRGPLALAIRKHIQADLTLDELAAHGAFQTLGGDRGPRSGALRQTLETLLKAGDAAVFLRHAVQARQNIVISGGTSTGKTTFANALIGEIPPAERLVFIEDAPELRLHHPNAIGLVAVRGELGETLVTAEDLLQASLRMRPDRIILGELRGKEALSFIRAANTGHPGSITTVHADDPAGALNQIALMMLQAGTNLSRAEAKAYISEVVDIWVQLARRNGQRQVDEITFNLRA